MRQKQENDLEALKHKHTPPTGFSGITLHLPLANLLSVQSPSTEALPTRKRIPENRDPW